MIHKIKAEIERLKAWQPIASPSLDKLCSFLDSLQEEPVSEDKCNGCNNVKGCITCVDRSEWAHYEEPKDHCKDPCKDHISEEFETEWKEYFKYRGDVASVNIKDLALHFAEWGKNQLFINADLEDFAKREAELFAEREYEIGDVDWTPLNKGFYWGCKTGANWQKAQLLQNAIGSKVIIDAGGYPCVACVIELYDYDKDVPLAKGGDKVKIVVIKEEE